MLCKFTNCTILRDHKIFKEDLWVRNGVIVNPEEIFFLEKIKADQIINCDGSLISAGFIDIQINGGWGTDFSFDVEKVEEGVAKVAKNLLKHGVTSFCPTMVTSTSETYHTILPHIKKKAGGLHGATVLGVHLEGPFINKTKKGAHFQDYIIEFEKGMDSVNEVYGSLEDVKIVTLAPELKGAMDAIKGLCAKGINVSVGHSAADLAIGEESVQNGVTLITHLFNAMLPFHHRDPGLVGLLASPIATHIHYGIISDGLHTHPATLRIAYRTNRKSLVLVSDAVPALGLKDGHHRIGTMSVDITEGRAYIAGTNTLCGSTSALDECVQKFKEAIGCSTEYVLEAASLHPARALGIDSTKGTLSFGADADFIFLDPKTLTVKSTWIGGECVYSKENEYL